MKTIEDDFEHLSDHALLQAAEGIRGRERLTTVDLVRALAEIEKRGLYLGAGFASLYAYCTKRLRLSEYEAYLRMQAARTALFYPVILEYLADGRLTLTAISLLSRHLTEGNHASLLDDASYKSKREILELVAARHPQPAVASSLTRIAESDAVVAESAVTSATFAREPEGTDPVTLVDAAREALARSDVTPLAPERYKLQVTISRETHEILRRLQDLMRHTVPDGDPAPIVERALQMLLATLEKRITARVERPHRLARCRSGSRYVPAHVRQAVWIRDRGQCAFVGTEARCEQRSFLELHHVIPYAEGGTTTVDNIELRCRAHNAYEATVFSSASRHTPVHDAEAVQSDIVDGSRPIPATPG